jgi:hypothetical protein
VRTVVVDVDVVAVVVDVVVVVSVSSSTLGVDDAAAAAGPGMPKGVSSSLTLEDDATRLVVGSCVRGGCAPTRALSLRRCCDERWFKGGTVRNCPEVVDMVISGWWQVVRLYVNVDFIRWHPRSRWGEEKACRVDACTFGAPWVYKSQSTTHTSWGPLDRTAFANFGVSQPQIINHQLNSK